MTSLAQQLKKLAVPHIEAIHGEDKQRPSLLFDPKEASAIDKETFFHLGVSGLEALQNIDPVFVDFEETLFSDQSLMFERSVQTKEVNQKLDETIARFLQRLSPYFLIKPAHKALEWLVYRYHIHFYNVDDFMRCVLPYHETKMFVRVVQLLKLDSAGSAWNWLEPLQKSGVHLTRTTYINHCLADPGFLMFVCDMIPQIVKAFADDDDKGAKQLTVVFSFFALTLLGVLQRGTITETMVSCLVPAITRGLRSKLHDYQAACYMVYGQLMIKAKIKEPLLKSLIRVLTKYCNSKTLYETISCIVVTFQTQDFNKLSKRSFKQLCMTPGLESVIEQLSRQYHIDPFLRAIMEYLVPVALMSPGCGSASSESSEDEQDRALPDYEGLLCWLLTDMKLDDDMAQQVAKKVLDIYVTNIGDQAALSEYDCFFKRLIRLFETHHPTGLDLAVTDVLSSCDAQFKTSIEQHLHALLSQSMVSSQHQILPNMGASLVVSLNHRNPAVRRSAVKYLLEAQDLPEDQSFMESSVLSRLDDDSKEVVTSVLSHPKELLNLFKDQMTTLVTTLLKLISSNKGGDVTEMAIVIVCQCPESVGSEVSLSLLPNLFVTSKGDAKRAQLIIQSELAKRFEYMSSGFAKWLNITEKICQSRDTTLFGKCNACLIENIAKGFLASKMDIMCLMTFLHDMANYASPRQSVTRCLLVLLIHKLMASKGCPLPLRVELAELQIDILQRIIPNINFDMSHGDHDPIEALLQRYSSKLHKSSALPGAIILHILKMLIIDMKGFKLRDADYFDYKCTEKTEDKSLKLFIALFALLLDMTTSKDRSVMEARKLVHSFLQTHFSDKVKQMKFYSLFWSCHCNSRSSDLGLTSVLQARVLKLSEIQMQACTEPDIAELLRAPAPVLTSLLIALTSPHPAFRDIATQCFMGIMQKCQDTDAVFLSLLQKIVHCKVEIIHDADYVQQVLCSVFSQGMSSDTDDSSKSPSKRKTRRKSLKSVVCRQSLDLFMKDIISKDTPDFIRLAMLKMMSRIQSVDVFSQLLPLLGTLLEVDASTLTEDARSCVPYLIERYTSDVASTLTPDAEGMKTFMLALISTVPSAQTTVQEIAIQQVTKAFFSCLDSACQQLMLSSLFSLAVSTVTLSVTNSIQKCLKHISMSASHLCVELEKILPKSTSATVMEAKRRKRQSGAFMAAIDMDLDSPAWRRVSFILETIQGIKKIDDKGKLLTTLFQILPRVLELEVSGSAEYLKQLILSCVYNITSSFVAEMQATGELDKAAFNMEMIVQCIRTSENPQTHHQALLVLTVAAQIQPEHLLHNVMSVFTFMGASILRQDDSYSFHIISRILETVIPALITACETKKASSARAVTSTIEDKITVVLRVFVDAYPHIPVHRQIMLFTKLISVVGESYLWRLLLLFNDFIISKGSENTEGTAEHDGKAPATTNDIEFCLNLSSNFSPTVQVQAANKIITYIASLPEDKSTDASTIRKSVMPISLGKLAVKDAEIFSVPFHSAKQMRHFKFSSLSFLATLLSGNKFIAQVADSESESLLPCYQGLLEVTLEYITQLNRSSDHNQNKPTARFWKALLHKAFDLLDKIVSLLTDSSFYEVVVGLLNHPMIHVQRKAMDLLNTKLQHQKQAPTKLEESLMVSLVVKLMAVVKETAEQIREHEELAVNGQTALYSLKVLCRHIGDRHPDIFIEVLKLSTWVFTTCADVPQLAACALLCVAEVCSSVKAHAIQHLSSFMPKLIQLMRRTEELEGHELLLLSAVTAVLKVLENLVHFLSPYLLDILVVIISLSASSEDADIQRSSHLLARLKAVRHSLATALPTRVLLPAIVSCYDKISTDNHSCITSLMSLLSEHLIHISKEDLNSHHQQLLTFFFTCLDFRRCYSEIPEREMHIIEGSTIDTIISMVMKLSESSFRPMLFKLYDWATRNEDQKDRILVFYRLADRLAEKLRSLFTLFAGHIVRNCSRVLDQNNSTKVERGYFGKGKRARRKSTLLLNYVLGCLHKCFLYDNEGFLTKDRFDNLMQPLVDQIENQQGGDKAYDTRITDCLVPCIAQFAVAAHDDSLWRPLNYQILLKTRNSSPQVRSAALKVVDELHRKLGEDYMTLLPETVPFLAELMEDESEDVEKQCQAVICEMEKTVGEPLQKYF